MKNKKPIYVTQPSLAPLEEYTKILEGIWERGILTHNGPVVQQFEKEFCKIHNIKNMVAVSNGTIALQMAIRALELKGEIITTPFTWIASISAIKWEGCKPVFCDIEPDSFNIDPLKIEEHITENTVAIMPVHVFGNPCDIDSIESIAKKHGLKVIYDAAHAVGSRYKGKSVLEYGDISATSFHATKIMNTAEGGGCITNDEDLHEKLKRIRFFGYNDAKEIVEDGFNGKMTEVHAALGIANLKYYDNVLTDRLLKYNFYRSCLSEIPDLKFQVNKFGESNYSYFPVVFKSEETLLNVEKELNSIHIYPRRYFYPSVNTFQNILPKSSMPVAEDVSNKVLCLPNYFNLETRKINQITEQIRLGVL